MLTYITPEDFTWCQKCYSTIIYSRTKLSFRNKVRMKKILQSISPLERVSKDFQTISSNNFAQRVKLAMLQMTQMKLGTVHRIRYNPLVSSLLMEFIQPSPQGPEKRSQNLTSTELVKKRKKPMHLAVKSYSGKNICSLVRWDFELKLKEGRKTAILQ